MTNDDIEYTWEFHKNTKLPGGVLNRVYPDLYNSKHVPRLFKTYQSELDTIELRLTDDLEEFDALHALENEVNQDERFPYLETIARILHYSAGITKTLTFSDRSHQFRAASCTGALYHIQMYIISARLPGLAAGIYHYDPEHEQLQLLRKGDYRQAVIDAAGKNYTIEDSPLVIVYTSLFWINAYKYQSRAYRHAFWDSGTIMANTLAMASMLDLTAEVVTGFVDTDLAAIIGIDPAEELPLAIMSLGYTSYTGLKEAPPLVPEQFTSVPGELQRDFPAIRKMHEESSLTSIEAVQTWRDAAYEPISVEPTDIVQLKPQSTRKMASDPLEKVIARRGSTRKFAPAWLDFTKFSNLMKMGTQPIPTDFYGEFGQIYNKVYVVVNGVEEVPIGSYRYFPEHNQLQSLQQGYFREECRKMGLNQDLAHDCAVMVVFIADLEQLLEVYGNRAYRIAQLEAAIFAGKMYLAAYAQGIGATGLTFADDEVTAFFDEPNNLVSFMLCLGIKAKKS